MPTGGRCCWRGTGSRRRCAAYLAGRDFLRSTRRACRARPGNETHLHAFATEAIGNDGAGETLYLHTSPEFA